MALELPGQLRAALEAWATGVVREAGGGLRAVSGGSLHVTLCFLGLVAAERVDAVAGACEVARGAGVGRLRVAGAVWLPRRRPRVLAVKLSDPEERLSALQSKLALALSTQGLLPADARPFLPHVTVARVQRGMRLRAAEPPGPPDLVFTSARVVLYRSHLGHGPARYEALHQFPLSQG